jgi:AcrR family transcriptional regulator
MAHTPGVRAARKQQTRQALLDSALRLLEQQSLSSLGLREVTREAGIAPAAFYRHFPDVSQLGVALVHESFSSLHAMVGDIRAEAGGYDEVIDRTVDVIAAHVRERRGHFRFIARERHGGVAQVRAAIADELAAFVSELAADLALMPELGDWSADDLRMLSELYVNMALLTASALLEAVSDGAVSGSAGSDGTETERRITETARKQLRLIAAGRRHWQGRTPSS